MTRPSWTDYAIGLAKVAAGRSEDMHAKVGCVILRHDNSVASVGYNGVPAGIEIDWTDRDARRPYVIHAEANALRHVRPGECRLMAVTMMPCIECLKLAASYGIDSIVYLSDYESAAYDKNATVAMAFTFGIDMRKV